MGYTYDLELDPPNAPAADAPIVPLFRRSFATSKFASLAKLVADLKEKNIRHRALRATLSGFATGAVVTATDEEIQNALLAAGEQALPAPEATGLTVYWAQRTEGGAFFPHVILIDAAEPLWRTRNLPRLETVPNQDDPAFQRVVTGNLPSLEIIEQAGLNIAQLVHSPSGTRTLAVIVDTFVPPPTGATITLTAHRLPNVVFGIAEEFVVITALTLDRAPWEDDFP